MFDNTLNRDSLSRYPNSEEGISTKCSSGMLNEKRFTMLCTADNKNPTGVYSHDLCGHEVLTLGTVTGAEGSFSSSWVNPVNWASVDNAAQDVISSE